VYLICAEIYSYKYRMEIFVIAVLILINGFFALSEIAMVSSKKTRLEQKRIEGSKGAKTALKLLENSENFLSAIQVGITLIGIVTGVYGGINIADDVAPVFQNIDLLAPYAKEIALAVTVIVITYVSIVIGELVPKTIALSKPERIAISVAPVISYFSTAFYPFVKLLSVSTSFINRVLGIKKMSDHMTEAELRQILKTATAEGIIEKEQNIIYERVFNFADKRAKHIMTHRHEVEWLDINQPDGIIRNALLNTLHSKIICCKDKLEDIAGILRLKDYFKAVISSDHVEIAGLLSEPVFVPENMNAQKVMTLLKQKETHICCVVNEYGGFEGIITLHDIIENIAGQFPDDLDPEEPYVFVRDDKSVLVSGDAPIETLSEIMEGFMVDFEQNDYSTVAGFIFSEMDHIPRIGDKIIYNDYTLEVVDVDGNKTDKVLITKNK
jgi:putative hemolysin